ncbi:3-hydroxyacyl-ACP dehydratase FabZ family protein [Flagellimonas onchidii]|uniref:3-hydroxyacyl-ACP dehydratase FabZ family protein n=1 Tax=Flagellimonas onchidii TaxID=2562684 RepID=UPI0010A68834|nr:FabA/FabZ family ACP-dehydratase [Allomuricauda onchidii]
MSQDTILSKLPYSQPFLFVDELTSIDENGVAGAFTFHKHLEFYKGHFKKLPVTPGVILTECCAQIGLVCLGIFLLSNEAGQNQDSNASIALSSSEMDFYLPVFPEEKVQVISEKVYFRFNKLKCKVKMYNTERKLVCRGVLSGMIKMDKNGR